MSIEIHRDQKRARAVERAAREFLPLATPSLTAELGALELLPAAPVPQDGTPAPAALTDAQGVEVAPPDVEQLQRFAALALTKARLAMVGASSAYRRDLHQVNTRRQRRDRVAAEAYERVSGVRKALEGLLGEREAIEVLGVEGPTPREPARLLEHLVEAVDRLSAPETELPPPRVADLAPYPQLAQSLVEARDALAAAIEAVEEEVAEEAPRGAAGRVARCGGERGAAQGPVGGRRRGVRSSGQLRPGRLGRGGRRRRVDRRPAAGRGSSGGRRRVDLRQPGGWDALPVPVPFGRRRR